MLFSLLKPYLDTDTALKVSQSVYCFTTSISHGVENYFPRLWGMGISDAIFCFFFCTRFNGFVYFQTLLVLLIIGCSDVRHIRWCQSLKLVYVEFRLKEN